MRKFISAGVAAFLAISGGAASAQAIACGGDYVVGPGDTLSKIAGRAYGDRKSYQFLYSANRSVIGPNPSLIEIGMRFAIPCLDGAAASSAPTSTVTQPQTTGVLPAPAAKSIRIVTGSDWAPYLDQNQEQGGMLVEVLNTALAPVQSAFGNALS